MMFELIVDFNAVSEEGIVTSVIEAATGPRDLHVGDRVLLNDDGDHEAWGIVRRVSDGLVDAEVDWSTWVVAGSARVMPHAIRTTLRALIRRQAVRQPEPGSVDYGGSYRSYRQPLNEAGPVPKVPA
jgi:hypothetical protein